VETGSDDRPDKGGQTILTLPASRLFPDRTGYLPQRLDLPDGPVSALDTVLACAPQATVGEVRARLARMLIRGDSVFRPVGSLSGGERFRVSLARLLCAEPPAQLLILDEPTNNLDQSSVDHLVEALSAYHGALVVVSHNRDFLRRLGVTVDLELYESAAGEKSLVVQACDAGGNRMDM
jgi:ATPase subunit of ABC transporter with duplicated ATPase domains